MFHGRWIRWIASFIVAVGMWFSVTLIKTYQTTIDLPVKYVNLPPGMELSRSLPGEFHISVTGKGQNLLVPYLRLRRDTFPIDLSLYLNKKSLVTSQLTHEISILINTLKIISIEPDTILLGFESKSIKKVPIRPDITINTENGYMLANEIKTNPDSAILIGNARDLRVLDSWSTEELTLTHLKGEYKGTIPLVKSPSITVNPKEVSFQLDVKRFTEKTSIVKVHLINEPAHQNIRIMPDYVKLIYSVPFDMYEKVSSADFFISIDFQKVDTSTVFLVPTVEKKPEIVRNIRIEPRYIRYVITQL
ncbi:MAG: hypothetical protein NZ108_09465 [Bacteroidia bacterium]|nr:hypothetical protein [Bacteroidia bacterium]